MTNPDKFRCFQDPLWPKGYKTTAGSTPLNGHQPEATGAV